MEADSTTKKWSKFGHSPASAETLSNPDDFMNVCFICRAKDTEINISEKRQEAESNEESIFFAESKNFLLCGKCYQFCHLHCHVNEDITVEILLTYIEQQKFECINCQYKHEQN